MMNNEAPDVFIYITKDGVAPLIEWLNALRDRQARAKIRIRIDRLCLGLLGDCKSVGEGVHELRIHWGKGYRVYFCFDGKQVVVLLCGGNKSTQSKDIERAKDYHNDYKKRKDEATQEL